MTALSTIKLAEPTYISANNVGFEKKSLSTRVFFAVLPFIALHKPFGRVVTLITDSTRIISSFSQFVKKREFKSLVASAIAITTLAGTYFMHPLGLCISTLHGFGYDVLEVVAQLQAGNIQEVFYTLFSMVQHLLYLSTMLVGSLEVVALSILFNMAVEVSRSKQEFQKGNMIEGSSHLLMSLVRFSQALPYIEKACFKYNIVGKELSHKLTKKVAKVRNAIAYHLYSSARTLVSPLWKTTENWLKTVSAFRDPESSTWQKTVSAAKSVFSSIVLFPFALCGLAAGQILHFSAFLLSTQPYIHLKGKAEPKKISDKSSFSIFQLNCCLPSGGFALMFGGIAKPNSQRVDEIANKVLQSGADLVCLQEVSDLGDALALWKRLSSEYPEAYVHVGPPRFVLQNPSGIAVFSKLAIEKGSEELHSFSDTPAIKGTELMVNKCFFQFTLMQKVKELAKRLVNITVTHLSPSSSDANPTIAESKTRLEEQQRILDSLQKRQQENGLSSFVIGDMNIQLGSPEYRKSPLFMQGIDLYNQNRKLPITDADATSQTDVLIQRNWYHKEGPNEGPPERFIIDYSVLFPNSRNPVKADAQRIATAHPEDPVGAISDHHGILTTVEGISSRQS